MQADRPAISGAERALELAARVFFVLGAAGVCLLMVLTVVGVFWRYALNDPIFGISDISVLTLVVVAACAVAYGATTNAHVAVDLISMAFGRRVTRWTDAAMRALAAAISGLAAYALADKACGFERACITTNLSIEHAPYYYVLAISMGFLALLFVTHLVVGLRHLDGDDPNEPGD